IHPKHPDQRRAGAALRESLNRSGQSRYLGFFGPQRLDRESFIAAILPTAVSRFRRVSERKSGTTVPKPVHIGVNVTLASVGTPTSWASSFRWLTNCLHGTSS